MLRPGPTARHFAATEARLLALDASGALIDELPEAEFDSVIAGGRRRTPDIYVLRKDDPDEKRVFAIEHIEKPLGAKAMIEEAYLPPRRSGVRGTRLTAAACLPANLAYVARIRGARAEAC